MYMEEEMCMDPKKQDPEIYQRYLALFPMFKKYLELPPAEEPHMVFPPFEFDVGEERDPDGYPINFDQVEYKAYIANCEEWEKSSAGVAAKKEYDIQKNIQKKKFCALSEAEMAIRNAMGCMTIRNAMGHEVFSDLCPKFGIIKLHFTPAKYIKFLQEVRCSEGCDRRHGPYWREINLEQGEVALVSSQRYVHPEFKEITGSSESLSEIIKGLIVVFYGLVVLWGSQHFLIYLWGGGRRALSPFY